MPPQLRLFGTPALVIDEAPHRVAVPSKALALLGLLAAQPGRAIDRAQLAAALYPDELDADARTNSRRQLHLLTKALPAGCFKLTKNAIELSGIETDVARFLREDTAEAMAQRRGDYCAGVFDEALTPVREILDRRYALLLRRVADEADARGDAAEAVRCLERLLLMEPFDESSVRCLMQLRLALGDRGGAMREYTALAQRLRVELDAEPERETAMLFQGMLFAHEAGSTPHNLSAASTSFVGREPELDLLAAALGDSRLVTIVGPPGIGKTRLARRGAFNHLDAFPGGVWFIDVAAVGGLAEFEEQLLSVLQVRPSGTQDRLSAICSALAGKRVLLLFDNCEHVVEPVRGFAETLLRQTTATILVTSRRRLSADAERVLPLDPLEVPHAGQTRAQEVKHCAAVRLFAERAVAVSPSLRITDDNASAVAAVVRKLDGIPLAIEIVAARANLLTVDGMLKRLSDSIPPAPRGSDARYATVNAAIAWSYDLLSAAERRLFESLAVFSADWTLEAAESVCAHGESDVFAALSELVESSLVRAERSGDDIRYSMFETTRAFAAARLQQAEHAHELRRRYAAYYANLAQSYAPNFKSEREVEFYRRCDREYGNFRAAMTWARTHDFVLATQMVIALWRYAIFSWRMNDFDPILDAAFKRAGELPQQDVAILHLAAGMFAKERMDGGNAFYHLENALALFRQSGDSKGEIDALFALSLITFNHGDTQAAQRLCEQCLVLQQAAGDVAGAAATTANLGAVAQMQDDDNLAIEFFQRALGGFRATNNERGVAYAYRALALSYETLGRLEDAVAAARQSVALYEHLGERSRLADGLVMLGNVLANVGRLSESLDAFVRAFATLESAEHPLFTAIALLGYASTAQLGGNDLEAVRAAAKGRDIAQAAGIILETKYVAFVDALLDRAKASLGEQQFAAAWTAGRSAELGTFASNARDMLETMKE